MPSVESIAGLIWRKVDSPIRPSSLARNSMGCSFIRHKCTYPSSPMRTSCSWLHSLPPGAGIAIPLLINSERRKRPPSARIEGKFLLSVKCQKHLGLYRVMNWSGVTCIPLLSLHGTRIGRNVHLQCNQNSGPDTWDEKGWRSRCTLSDAFAASLTKATSPSPASRRARPPASSSSRPRRGRPGRPTSRRS